MKKRRRKPQFPIDIDFVREQLEGDRLDLGSYSLEAAPIEELKSLPQATRVDLSNNRITTLSADFGALRHLLELNLSKNKLDKLPDNFGQLSNLQRLDLCNNKLTTLPHAFWQLSKLEWLDLKGNQLEPELKRVVKESQDKEDCAQKVRQFLQNKARDRERKRHLEQEQVERPTLRTSVLRDLPKRLVPVNPVNRIPQDLEPKTKSKPESKPELELEPKPKSKGFRCPKPGCWCLLLTLVIHLLLITITVMLYTPTCMPAPLSTLFWEVYQNPELMKDYLMNPELMKDYLMNIIRAVNPVLLLVLAVLLVTLVVLLIVRVVVAIATLCKLHWHFSRPWIIILLLIVVVPSSVVFILKNNSIVDFSPLTSHQIFTGH